MVERPAKNVELLSISEQNDVKTMGCNGMRLSGVFDKIVELRDGE